MKSAVYLKAGQVGLVEIDHPQILDPDDAIIRIVRTCVCGSDLWSYRNEQVKPGRMNSGHEAIGIVEEVGEAVTTVKAGDFVIAPLLMDVGTATLAEQDMTGLVTGILAITGQMGCKRNICALSMPTGLW